MRSFLRRTGLILATGSLVFFLSCERHHVGELSEGHHTKGDHAAKPETHETHDSTSHAADPATEHSHTSQTPDPRNSPANFFPDKPKP